MNHFHGITKMVPMAFLSGFIAGLILGLVGCASMTKHSDARPTRATSPNPVPTLISNEDVQAMIAAIVKAEISAAMNLNTGPITGVNYQTVLPMGMVVLLTMIVLSQTASNSLENWLLHRQEMMRLKRLEPAQPQNQKPCHLVDRLSHESSK